MYTRWRRASRVALGFILVATLAFLPGAAAAQPSPGQPWDSLSPRAYLKQQREYLKDSGHAFGDWPTWQKDLWGSRFQPFERKITPRTAGDLELKWAFAFPKVPYQTSRSQPAVVGDTLYVGGTAGHFYALNADTGKVRWKFDLSHVSGPIDDKHKNLVRGSATVVRGRVYFGDSRGYFYALDADNGKLLWSAQPSDHPAAQFTSSPIVFDGRVYVGVSSKEAGWTTDHDYPCCTFRGQVVALDAKTGDMAWQYYTVPPPRKVGEWPSGATKYAPSGGAVWSTPVIDPFTRTLFVGTGQNYTGKTDRIDTVLALNIDTGKARWTHQMTDTDTWTVACDDKNAEGYCPGLEDGAALDFDFGAAPNVFVADGRLLVGIGQKSGIYHVLDAVTGEIVWQRQLSTPDENPGGNAGIQWGTSWDGSHLYVATLAADPPTLFALDPGTGDVLWETPHPADGCETGGAAEKDICQPAFTPAVTSSPGLVYEGSADGKMRVYSSRNGELLWEYDTTRSFDTVNGRPGHGSAVSGNGGAVVAHGMMYIQSGYYDLQPPGNVLLAFGPDSQSGQPRSP